MGRPEPTEDEREARRTALLDAAVGAIRKHGPGVSMEDLAKAAGVTKPILYRHFGHRDGLTTALATRFALGLEESLTTAMAAGNAPRETIEKTIDAYLAFVERDPEVYRFLVRRLLVHEQQRATGGEVTVGNFLRQVGNQVALVLGEQLRAANVDSGGAEPLAHGIVGMVHAAGDWWLDRQTMPRATLVDYVVGLLWGGFIGIGLGPQPANRTEHS
ncbi:MAG TPA: TetR/AcrR family transcriptional regulator [Acidimicrobiales bacterium]|nr:TetR/AcrR family transcriptional regulator [Acidimicrobiales bacterium]